MRNLLRTASTVALAAGALTLCTTGARAQVVISEIYPGGGSGAAGTAFNFDYVELFNNGTSAIDLTGFSLQYAAATPGATIASTTSLTGTIPAKGYFLLQTGTSGAAGTASPVTPNQIGGGLNLGGGAGKLFFASDSTTVTFNTTNNTITSTNVLDYVGYGNTANVFEGAAPAPSTSGTAATGNNANSIFRTQAAGSFVDTNQNAVDFTFGTPSLQSSAVAVPEPGTFALLALGGLPILGLVARRRK